MFRTYYDILSVKMHFSESDQANFESYTRVKCKLFDLC